MVINKQIYYNANVALLLVPGIYTSFFPGKINAVTLLCVIPMTIFILIISRSNKSEFDGGVIFYIFYFLNILVFFRAFCSAENNEDYANLIGIFFISLIIPLYLKTTKEFNIICILKSICFCAIPMSFITYFYKPTDAFMSFQHNISIIFLFILFVPFLRIKWRLIVFFLVLIGVMYDITRRSFLINSTISIIILVFYCLTKKNIFFSFIKKIYFFICVAPLILFYLGINKYYNVFKIGENINFTVRSEVNERNIFIDSRTGIYEDVFKGLLSKDRLLFGLGGNGRVATSLVNTSWGDFYKIYLKGRRKNESGMLNYIQWGGIVAGFFYWLLLANASFKAIFKSRNDLVFMIGVFILFKISYSFIEDAISVNIYSFYFMFTLSICYNKKIRFYTNKDLKKMLSLVFK